MSEAIKSSYELSVASCPSWTRHQVLILLGILLVAAGLRIARNHYDSLSFDDQWHLELSTGRGSPHVRLPEDTFIAAAPDVTSLTDAPPFYKVWTNMDFVVHPPLYPLVLRIWREIFGEGDIAARSFSITCSLIAIALLYAAAKELSGPAVAGWAALIWAAAPTQVYLAQQVRGYQLLATLSMGAVWALIRLEKLRLPNPSPGNPREGEGLPAIALGLCVLGMMLTHYFAIGACTMIGLYVIIRLKGDARRNAIAALFIAAAVYLIAWGPYFKQQIPFFSATADTWLAEPDPRHTLLTLGRLATAPWRLVINYVNPGKSPALLAGALFIIPAFLLRRRKDLLIWYLWLLGTIGFVGMLDLVRDTKHLVFTRYISFGIPAVAVLGVGLLRDLKIWRHVIPVGLVIVSLACSSLAYTSEGEPDWRPYGAAIDANVASDETLIFYPGTHHPWHDEILYLGAAHYSKGFPRSIIKLSGPAPLPLMRQIPGQTAWLISGPMDREISQLLPGAEAIGSPIYIPNLAYLTHIRLNTPQYADTLR